MNPLKKPRKIETLARTLENGVIRIQGQFMLGSNYTFLATVEHEGDTIPAVYKPMRGELPLWDFPAASLAGREVAAFRVSEALGWGLVPRTVLREGPFGPGSLQLFINYDPNINYFTFSDTDKQRLRPVALFDLLINNADRKGSHVLLQKRTHQLFAIDHGLCFHIEDKLRTVIWDFAGEPIPDELLKSLEKFIKRINPPLPEELAAYLSSDEIEALTARAKTLLKVPVFPKPPADRRSFPYPPV
jgi:hypothetical protein